MKTLHLLKSDPDEKTNLLISAMSEDGPDDDTIVRMNDDTDYENLIDLIFSHDKIISWW